MAVIAPPVPSDAVVTIGEAARRSGFTIKCLRYYERRGLLRPARRRPSGYRVYTVADLRRLEFIRGAKALGLTLAAIQPLVGPSHEAERFGTRARLARTLDERIAQTARQIETLQRLHRELRQRRTRLSRRRARPGGRPFCTCLDDGDAARDRMPTRRSSGSAR
jgi:MerR family transcriptional regulator, copper efflux regulator